MCLGPRSATVMESSRNRHETVTQCCNFLIRDRRCSVWDVADWQSLQFFSGARSRMGLRRVRMEHRRRRMKPSKRPNADSCAARLRNRQNKRRHLIRRFRPNFKVVAEKSTLFVCVSRG